MSHGDVEAQVVDAISAVDREEWNRLATNAGFYSSHEWLSTVEAETEGQCRYVMLREQGRLLAAMPVYLVDSQTNSFYRPSTHFDLLRPPQQWESTCLAGSNRGYRNAFVLDPALTEVERRRVMARLGEMLWKISSEAGVDHVALLFLTADAAGMLDEIGGCTPPLLTYTAESRLSTVGSSFEEFLATLSPFRRKTTRKEMRTFARAGLTVASEPIWEQRDLVVRLVGNLNRKHERGFTEADHAAALDRQRTHLSDHAVLLVCRTGGVPVGLSMGFVWDGWFYLWYAGFDYDRLPGAFEYFNMCLHEPLRYCYENGLRGVHLGVSTHYAKGIRGASLAPLYSSVWSPRSSEVDAVSDAARRRVEEYWRGQMRRMRGAFPDSTWHLGNADEDARP